MNLETVIAERKNKVIYRDGDRCVKVFNRSFSKADILNESLNQARVEDLGLNVPKILEVTTIDETHIQLDVFLNDGSSKTTAMYKENRGPGRPKKLLPLVADG